MAVTTQYSDEVTAIRADSFSAGLTIRAPLEVYFVTFEQDGAGDANSLVDLIDIPPGKYVLLGDLCSLDVSALGTGTTMDIGWTAYTNSSNTAVAADIDGLDDGVDVSSDVTIAMGTNTAVCDGAGRKAFDSKSGVRIQAKILGAGIPDDATIEGFIVLAKI
jgi:hypothetical protein